MHGEAKPEGKKKCVKKRCLSPTLAAARHIWVSCLLAQTAEETFDHINTKKAQITAEQFVCLFVCLFVF